MGKITETSLWNWLKKMRSERIELERMENLVGSGGADVYGFAMGIGAFYLELKTARRTGRKLFPKGYLRPSQILWHKRYAKLGANSHFLVGIETVKFLVPSKLAESMEEWTLDDIWPYKIDGLRHLEQLLIASALRGRK